jgi:hypothetical protein
MEDNLIELKNCRLDVLAFLTTLQLIVPDIDDAEKIAAFGSGFFLNYN